MPISMPTNITEHGSLPVPYDNRRTALLRVTAAKQVAPGTAPAEPAGVSDGTGELLLTGVVLGAGFSVELSVGVGSGDVELSVTDGSVSEVSVSDVSVTEVVGDGD